MPPALSIDMPAAPDGKSAVRQWGLVWGLPILVMWLLIPRDFSLGPWWLPVHTVLEVMSVVVSTLVYVFGRRTLLRDSSVTTVVVAHLFLLVAIFDVAHLLSFPGMPSWFTPNQDAKSISFWLLARLVAAVAMWLVVRQYWPGASSEHLRHVMLGPVLAAALVLVPLVAWWAQNYPGVFWAFPGLTLEKKAAELLVTAMMGAALWHVLRHFHADDGQGSFRMVKALLTLIVSELCFMGYAHNCDWLIILGHVYKVLGYLLLFRAMAVGLISEPFARIRAAEAEASHARAELEAIFHAAPDPMVLVNDKGCIQHVNERFCLVFGYRLTDVKGLPVDILLPERLRSRHGSFVDSTLQSPRARDLGGDHELRARRRDGSEFPINVSLSPVQLRDMVGVIASVRDVTDRERLLRETQASEMRLRSFLDNSMDWVWETDAAGIITYSSKGVENLLGIDSLEIVGRHLLSLMTGQDVLGMSAQIRELMLRREPMFHLEFSCLDSRQQTLVLQTHARPFQSADGRFSGYRGLSRDVTRQQQLQKDLDNSERVFRRAFDDFPIGMAFVGGGGDVVRANAFLCDLLGYVQGELDNVPLVQLFPLDHQRDVSREILSLREGRSSVYGAEVRLLTKGGDGRWVRMDVTQIHAAGHMQGTLLLMINDLSAEMEAKGQNVRLLSIIERMGDTVAVISRDGGCQYLNPYGRAMLGIDLNEDISHEPYNTHHPELMAQFLTRRALPQAARNGVWEGETVWRSRSGEEITTWQVIMAHKNADGEVEYWTTVARDIRERKRLEDRLSHQATHDALTGLPNRLLFRDRLQQAVTMAKRDQRLLATAFIDIDNFKRINDTFGHRMGDAVLVECARRLLQQLRSSATLARQGGDEFIVLLTDVSTINDVVRISGQLLSSLRRAMLIEERELLVTASIGVSVFPFDSDNVDELLRKADVAMYRGKEMGRNCVTFYAADMDVLFEHALQNEVDLRHAISSGEMFLRYQPKIDLKSLQVAGYEAFVCWNHPTRGVVPPSDFFPVVERNQLIVPLGEWALREACRQVRQWLDMGLDIPVVSVSVSAHQFENTDVACLVEQVLAEHRVPGERLELEIAEGVLMRDPVATTHTLSRVRKAGVGLSVDDFGIGSSSMGCLKQFPVKSLKIDPSFVDQISHNLDHAAIVRAIISMAHELGIHVVVEGVETREQLELLRTSHCDFVLGQLFSGALSPEEVASYQPIQLPEED